MEERVTLVNDYSTIYEWIYLQRLRKKNHPKNESCSLGMEIPGYLLTTVPNHSIVVLSPM